MILNKELIDYRTIKSKDFKGLSSNRWSMEKSEFKIYINLYRKKEISIYSLVKLYIFTMLRYIRLLILNKG